MLRVIEVDEDSQATLAVIETLDCLQIPYVIGGSLASSTHGIARTTRDADIMADMSEQHVQPLVQALGGAFYLSEDAMREAIARRSSFNLIHLASGFKIDIFIKPRTAFAQLQLERRNTQAVFPEPAPLLYVLSPEDILLNKLVWYKLGGGVSDRQWDDVLGVLKVQGSRLDLSYLKRWAKELNVDDLLERALTEIGQKR